VWADALSVLPALCAPCLEGRRAAVSRKLLLVLAQVVTHTLPTAGDNPGAHYSAAVRAGYLRAGRGSPAACADALFAYLAQKRIDPDAFAPLLRIGEERALPAHTWNAALQVAALASSAEFATTMAAIRVDNHHPLMHMPLFLLREPPARAAAAAAARCHLGGPPGAARRRPPLPRCQPPSSCLVQPACVRWCRRATWTPTTRARWPACTRSCITSTSRWERRPPARCQVAGLPARARPSAHQKACPPKPQTPNPKPQKTCS
jgi:hypothetical protein